MIFFYRALAAYSHDDGQPELILRPEVSVVVIGPGGSESCQALLDTGADNSVIPAQLARDLGIPLRPSTGPKAVTFGGHRLDVMLADVEFLLTDGSRSIRWKTRVLAHEFSESEEEILILGHRGFFDYFTAKFDGELCSVELIPNEALPTVSSSPSP